MTPFRGRRRKTGRKLKRNGIQLKKKQGRPKNEEPSSPKSCKNPDAIDVESSKLEACDGCCTPRGEKYRIPEISTCPRPKNEEPSSPKSCNNPDVTDVESSKLDACDGCCTPRGEKYRIPEISTCPPAPMKKRLLSSNCSLKRSPVSFFSPPDLDLFFFSIPNLSV